MLIDMLILHFTSNFDGLEMQFGRLYSKFLHLYIWIYTMVAFDTLEYNT